MGLAVQGEGMAVAHVLPCLVALAPTCFTAVAEPGHAGSLTGSTALISSLQAAASAGRWRQRLGCHCQYMEALSSPISFLKSTMEAAEPPAPAQGHLSGVTGPVTSW